MADAIFVGLLVGFFSLSVWLTNVFERMRD